MPNKILEIRDKLVQTPEDAMGFMQKMLKTGRVERMVILFKDSDEDGISFVVGSQKGRYTVADVNWDIDQFKLTYLSGGYEQYGENG